MARWAGLALFIVTLASCAGFRQRVAWPAYAPERELFLTEYRNDEENQALQSQAEYLGWVARFYLGSALTPGWEEMARQVLELVERPPAMEVDTRLRALGILIAAEWAKDNAVRRLDTRMLGIWSNSLMEALRRNDIEYFLDEVESDVRALLSGTLNAREIVSNRYYAVEFGFR